MKTLLASIIILFSVNIVHKQVPVGIHTNQHELLESEDSQIAENKKLVFDILRKVFQARNMELAPEYMAELYGRSHSRNFDGECFI